MREPEYNGYFPLQEYRNRIDRIRKQLAAAGMEAIFLTTKNNVEYTSGFLNGTWVHGFGEGDQFVLITADAADEPMLFAPETLRGCLPTTALSDVRIAADLSFGGNITDIVNAFTEKGLTRAKVGIELSPHERSGLTLPFFKLLKQSLPGVAWTDCTSLMYAARKRKSPLEIAKIRKAIEITSHAYEVALQEVHEGMSEKQLAQVIAVEMAKASADCFIRNPWFIYVHADGKNPIGWDGIASDYRFRKGDCIYLDCGFNYHGYNADMIRVASIGKPDPAKARIYYGARDANMALISYMKPGMSCGHLYQFLNETMTNLGFGAEVARMKQFGFIYEGHGVGLSVHEPPVINDSSKELLEEGMVMAIEANIFNQLPFAATTVALKSEENILIREDGCELLTTLSNDIWVSER